MMGYQPRSPYYEMHERSQKEVEQLRVANNELTAELHRYKERERLRAEGRSPVQLARKREEAEDALWEAEADLKMERSYAKGFATVGLLTTPATVALVLWTSGADSTMLMTFGVVFGLIFGGAALVGFGVTIAKVFGAIPEAKQRVKEKQRELELAVIREAGL